MNPCRSLAARVTFALGCCAALPAAAQPVPPPPLLSALPPAAAGSPARVESPAAASAPTAAASAPARAAPASAGDVRVFEDDQVRIEETRDGRGQIRRVKVHSKTSGKSYEITLPPGGKDPSQPRGTAGQAAWSLFDF